MNQNFKNKKWDNRNNNRQDNQNNRRNYSQNNQQPVKELSPEAKKKNSKIIQKVTDWQNFKFIKPLTCNTDGCWSKFKAKEINGRVVLQCPRCRAIQSHVPKAVMQTRFYISNVLRRIQAMYHSVTNFETPKKKD